MRRKTIKKHLLAAIAAFAIIAVGVGCGGSGDGSDTGSGSSGNSSVEAKINRFLASDPVTAGQEARDCRKLGQVTRGGVVLNTDYGCAIWVDGSYRNNANFTIQASGRVSFA